MKRRMALSLLAGAVLATSNISLPQPAHAQQGRLKHALLSMHFKSSHIRGGQTTKLRFVFSTPAPAGGSTINLASDHPGALGLPKKITVPAGVHVLEMAVTAKPVKATTDVTLHGNHNGIDRGDKLTIEP